MANHLPESDLLLLADTCLLWGHRLSEWCGHGPILEEDIALTNTALDLIGQARSLLQLVAIRREAAGGPPCNEDELAYFRDAEDFANLTLADLPNGDYARTVLRSFLLAAWFVPVWTQLAWHHDRALAAIAAEAVKAARMQLRHAREWVVRFGDGTEESRRRLLDAIAVLWPAAGELRATRLDGVDGDSVQAEWQATVAATFAEATVPLPVPVSAASPTSTALDDRRALLQEMQSLAREHPGARW